MSTNNLVDIKSTIPQGQFNSLVVATPDIVGRLVGRRVSCNEFDQKKQVSVELCSSILAWDVEQTPIENISIAGFHTGWQDVKIISDISMTRKMSWLNNEAIIIGDVYDKTGKIVPVAPRSILHEQIRLLDEMGLKATVATELEFYMTPISKENALTSDKRHDYAIDNTTNRMEPFFDELRNHLANSNITVESWQSEWGIGQWEMNLQCSNPIDVADSHILFKMAVKDLAIKHGYEANFMAKPKSDQVGSSGHIHISLHDKYGKSVFFDKSAPQGISKVALYAIEGILHYTPECLPLYASNINSFRRLAAGEFCGNGPSWGFDNRTVTCRVIGDNENSFHLEFRIPGADINPYLTLAGVLASVRKGIIDQNEPKLPITDNASSHKTKPYPLTLEMATENFINSSFSKDSFGADFVKHYGTLLLHECEQFRVSVTDWEYKRYLTIV